MGLSVIICLMSERISFVIEFLFDSTDRMVLKLGASWNEESINLSLSTFLNFLYENEDDLHESDSDFSYSLNKLLKKVNYKNEVIRAVTSDSDMALFFTRARKHGVDLFWKDQSTTKPVQWLDQIPLTLSVDQSGDSLSCELLQRDEWLNDPLAWMSFPSEKDLYVFSSGNIIHNPTEHLLDFLDQFLDSEKLVMDGNKSMIFINNVYKPNKKKIGWLLNADFGHFVPEDNPPFPVLSITEQDGSLVSSLSYKYGDVVINPEHAQHLLTDPKTGRKMNRMKDLEEIYQQDLINLFMENNLPFMLRSPKDIAKFLDKLVPVLREREWIIDCDTSEYNIVEEPVELEFNINQTSGSNIDWFHFEPTTEINGEHFPLTEIARLMVQNQGYIKTKSGYAKVNKKSRDDLELLAKFGALSKNKKFKSSEILPLISATNAKGNDNKSEDFISKIKSVDGVSTVRPSDRFKGELRDYQQFGLNWLNFLHSTGTGGVLADDMGLGKTVQTIAFADRLPGDGPCLVIGPTNVLYNWVKEIDKFTPHRTSIAYTGTNRIKHLEALEETDFIITTFGVIKNDIDWLGSVKFKAIFIDEAQYIKNPNTQVSKAVKMLESPFKLAMTGTPIENHLLDLWNLFDWVMPDYLGGRRRFELEIGSGNKDLVKTKIKPFVLRREKKEVLLSLPEKTEIILKCPMSEAQKSLYEAVLEAGKKGIKNGNGKNERLSILATLLKLRQVCIHPGLLKEMQGRIVESSKFELAKEKILELIDEGHKIVLFTQFTGMIDIMENWAEGTGINHYRIDGSVTGKKRMDIVDKFQDSDESGLFTISLKAGGVGINLTSADYVIHLDPWWNPAIEAQATDRVHRMGQKNKVIVYKFITEGTIEEKIQELQDQKRELLAEIIDIDSLENKKIDFNELKKILL